MNPLVKTDVYNLSHQMLKYNPDLEVSNIVNRDRPMILFGFDAIAHEVLDYEISVNDIVQATQYAKWMGLIFPNELWYKAIAACNDGIVEGKTAKIKQLIKIECLPDGTWVPRGTPFAQISNIKKGFGELVTWWEGRLLHAWFPSACATRALEMRHYLESRGERLTRFHSFGFRSHRSMEDAYWSSRAWSLFLPGTDDFNVRVDLMAESIPALAHKVVMNWDNELECYLNTLRRCAKAGYKMVSIVIDTTSSKFFIDECLSSVQDEAAKCGIIPVYRPDSGNVLDQADRICKKLDSWKYIPGKDFAFIIGDSVSFDEAREMDKTWKILGHNTSYLTWGIGAKFYNDLTRDWLGWSMKTSYSNHDDRMKCTDSVYKRSIPGKVSLSYDISGLLWAHTRTDDSCENHDYRTLNKLNPMSFGMIKMIANGAQNFHQKEIVFSDALQTKRTKMCDA